MSELASGENLPSFSVCVPAYNRPAELGALLESAIAQDYAHFDIVVVEDHSRERAAIRATVERYAARAPVPVRYHENAENLGYDANFRELLRRATGEYVFIMGNDDLVAPGALAAAANAIARHPGVGVVLRSFETFEGTRANVVRVSRYYPHEVLVAPGADAVVAFFRRLVVMSGLILRREDALRYETEAFDGTLFYQHFIASQLLMRRPGLIVPNILAHVRLGGIPEFGTSVRERGRFVPGRHGPANSVRLVAGQLEIAQALDRQFGHNIRSRVHRDFGRYIYPVLAEHADLGPRRFISYYYELARLGFWRYPVFHASALALGMFGRDPFDRIIAAIRRRLGYTPSLGRQPAAVRDAAWATRADPR